MNDLEVSFEIIKFQYVFNTIMFVRKLIIKTVKLNLSIFHTISFYVFEQL